MLIRLVGQSLTRVYMGFYVDVVKFQHVKYILLFSLFVRRKNENKTNMNSTPIAAAAAVSIANNRSVANFYVPICVNTDVGDKRFCIVINVKQYLWQLLFYYIHLFPRGRLGSNLEIHQIFQSKNSCGFVWNAHSHPVINLFIRWCDMCS